jgi:hypothetical protein
MSSAQLRRTIAPRPTKMHRPGGTPSSTRSSVQVDNLTKSGIDPKRIAHAAVDGTSGSMVLVDESLNPVTPALMYNSSGFDDEAERIAGFADITSITRGSSSALARMLHLQSLDLGGRGQARVASGRFHHRQTCRTTTRVRRQQCLEARLGPGNAPVAHLVQSAWRSNRTLARSPPYRRTHWHH